MDSGVLPLEGYNCAPLEALSIGVDLVIRENVGFFVFGIPNTFR